MDNSGSKKFELSSATRIIRIEDFLDCSAGCPMSSKFIADPLVSWLVCGRHGWSDGVAQVTEEAPGRLESFMGVSPGLLVAHLKVLQAL